MISLVRLIAASAMFVWSATLARAQSSAEASISNITIQLIDLDLADGIAPAMTLYDMQFGPIAGWEINDQHSGMLRGDSNIGSVPLAPTAISHSEFDAPHLRAELAAAITGASLSSTRLQASASMSDSVGANSSTAYVQTQNVWFALTPHTRITLSADLAVRSSAGPVAGPGLYAVGYAAAVLGLHSSRDNVWQSAPLYHNAVFGQDRGPGWDANYSMSFSNTQAGSADYALSMNAVTLAYTSAVIPAPVPEPASLAMLMGGLLVVAGRVRRGPGRPALRSPS